MTDLQYIFHVINALGVEVSLPIYTFVLIGVITVVGLLFIAVLNLIDRYQHQQWIKFLDENSDEL